MQETIEKSKAILLNAIPKQSSSSLKIDNNTLESTSVLPRLARYFELQGISINKIRLFKIKAVDGVNVLPIRMNVIGDGLAITRLLSMLAESLQLILVNDFSLQAANHGAITAHLQLWVFALSRQELKRVDGLPNKPITETSLRVISLKKIKWVGFIRQQNTLYGLLMLPSGKTVEVSKGSKVGKENARVIDITEKGVVYG